MRVVGYHVTNTGIIANSDKEVTKEPPYFDWLLRTKPDTLKVLYYMTQDVANLCKTVNMSKEELQRLSSKGNKAYLPPYKIDYIPNRYFALHKGYYWGAPFGFFADAHQFKNTEASEARTVDECIEKAKEAQEIGEDVLSALTSLGLRPKSLTSPIKTFTQEVLNKLNLSTVNDLPEEAGYYAYECCKGNWVEAFQLGHWDNVWNYDIVSAYPSQTAKLLDTRQGKWVQSKSVIKEAAYGYCKGEINIKKDTEFTPFIFKQDNDKNLVLSHNVVGKYSTFITKKELEFLEYWNQGSFDIENGWWWIPEKEVRPLEQTINWLYLEKEKAEGIKKVTIKRIMSAIFGKMLEIRNDDFGELMNPVWAAEIETNTRLKVADFILRHNKVKDLVHIAVDNAILSSPIETELEKNIGEWELSTISPCICTGTGAVAIRDDGVGEFHLKYDWMKEQIEQNPEASEYEMTKMIPVTVGEACGDKFEKLGQLQELTKVIGIGQGEKRAYKEQPQNGRELLNRTYSSSPWDISLIESFPS